MAIKTVKKQAMQDPYLLVFKWVSLIDICIVALWVLFSLYTLTRAINFDLWSFLFALAEESTVPYLILLPLLVYLRQKTLDGTLTFNVWHKVITWILIFALLAFGLSTVITVLMLTSHFGF